MSDFKEPVSVQTVVYRDGPGGREYLLLRRVLGGERFWQPVSGSLEPGESARDAALRELREETGIAAPAALDALDLASRFEIAPAWRPKYAPGVSRNTQYSFAARVDGREVAIDPREHDAAEWCPYGEAIGRLRYAPNRRALELVETGDAAPRRAYALETGRRSIELGRRTLVMGVLNTTPDSFSDGGAFLDPESAVARAVELEREGADIIDIGGESSRPGAEGVSPDEEARRVVPVVERLAGRLSTPISVDTTRASTAARALDAGAEIVNDISALRFDPELAGVVADRGAALVLMHMRGTPRTMASLPPSADIFGEIERELLDALAEAARAGVPWDHVVVDPGIGFGKTLAQNVAILARLGRFRALDRPLLVGTSRKSFLGALTGRDVAARSSATVASVAAAALRGAHVVRVHDVAAAVDAARVADAVLAADPAGPQV